MEKIKFEPEWRVLLSIQKQRSWWALRLPAEAIKDANTSRSKLRAALFALQRGCSGLFNVAQRSARTMNVFKN
jgi:hypothetical protein